MVKKVYIDENGELYRPFSGEERSELYYPVTPLDGEYLWRFAGGQTFISLEDAGEETETLRDNIAALIADPATPWEVCDEEDKEYINDTLKGWGIVG